MEKYTPQQVEELEELCRGYKQFLSENKTERLLRRPPSRWPRRRATSTWPQCRRRPRAQGRRQGVRRQPRQGPHAGQPGHRPARAGPEHPGRPYRQPRAWTLSRTPYEAGDMAYLDTHYYGGIKNYQWVTLPLASTASSAKGRHHRRHERGRQGRRPGVLRLRPADPPRKRADGQKAAKDAVEGEILDVIVGGRPSGRRGRQGRSEGARKAFVLDILKEQYGIEEEDFLSAEIEVVPGRAAPATWASTAP